MSIEVCNSETIDTFTFFDDASFRVSCEPSKVSIVVIGAVIQKKKNNFDL